MDECKAAKGFEHISAPLERVLSHIPLPDVAGDAPAAHPGLGSPSARYTYTDKAGVPVATVYRFDVSDKSDKSPPKKEFRPFCHYCQKWHAPDRRPLYRLDAISRYEGPVVLVEGEKCADALNGIGVLATTAFGGSNGVGKTDLSGLEGRNVIIWPDADAPGLKYAESAATALTKLGANSIRIVRLEPDPLSKDGFLIKEDGSYTYTLRRGWDAADAIAEGWDALRIRKLLGGAVPYTKNPYGFLDDNPVRKNNPVTGNERRKIKLFDDKTRTENKPVAESEPEWGEPDMSVLNPRQSPPVFPVELFGPFWSRWLLAKAEGCSAPVDYVGATLLSSASALIGCSRFVSPWEGWKEPPVLWMALVGNPSSGKSPALETVLSPLRKIEEEGAEGLKAELRKYEAEMLGAQCLRQDWERQVKQASKAGETIPPMPEGAQEPDRPERPRIFVSDATPEALARLLSCQPKGLLVTRDELAGWLGSFNRYAGGQGGDRAFWLEAYGGRPYVIDRARNGGEAVTVPHLAASILGGIQPDKLNSVLLKGDDDGLTARFLYCWPDPVPLERPRMRVESHQAEAALRWLNGLSMTPDGQGGSHPTVIMLEEDAATLFQDWRKAHAAAQPEGAMASWWGKMPGVCLRIALCLEYLWIAATIRQEKFEITYAAVEAATVMIEKYFKPMASRAYGDAVLLQSEKNAATLGAWIIKNNVEQVNVRDLYRRINLPGLNKPVKVKAAIEILLEADWLRPVGFHGAGRPKKNYTVNPLSFQQLTPG